MSKSGLEERTRPTKIKLQARPGWTAEQFVDKFGYLAHVSEMRHTGGKTKWQFAATTRRDGEEVKLSYDKQLSHYDIQQIMRIIDLSVVRVSDGQVRTNLLKQRRSYENVLEYGMGRSYAA